MKLVTRMPPSTPAKVLDFTVGFVIPTLGERPEWLANSMRALHDSSSMLAATGAKMELIVVCPGNRTRSVLDLSRSLSDAPGVITTRVLAFDKKGLSAAINYGTDCFSDNVTMVSWIGDDDVINAPKYVQLAQMLFISDCGFAIGSNYIIDEHSVAHTTLMASRLGTRFARYGRNYIPQPGSIVKRTLWKQVGGLDVNLSAAMDLDLFLKLDNQCDGLLTRDVVAAYRWHNTSVSGSKTDWSENDVIQDRYSRNIALTQVMRVRKVSSIMNKLVGRYTHRPYSGSQPAWVSS